MSVAPCEFNKIGFLVNMITSSFESRTIIQARKTGQDFKNVVLSHELVNDVLYFTIKTTEESFSLSVPVPYVRNGITLIKNNEVERAVCNYFDVKADRVVTYLDAIQTIFLGDYSQFVNTVAKKKTMFVQQLAYSVINDNTSVIVYNLQKAINEVVNKMPLHETDMNSWMMNRRLILLDAAFNELAEPADKLNYHVAKNEAYFERGWTSIGLSDGSLADKNYILTEDIRKCAPFGLRHHNPQRNLYSTLGMKGDELPLIRSEFTQKLINDGIERKGWNWFTAYVDLPDNFEDQILVDKRHANKKIVSERRVQCFGEILVKVGQVIKHGTPLSKAADGQFELYDVMADRSVVSKITKDLSVIGGRKMEVYNVTIRIERRLKDGTKITNSHGNKGVIKLADLGYAINPVTKKRQLIDTAVSGKTVPKRKNHGQIIEATYNNLNELKSVSGSEIVTKSSWSTRSRSLGISTRTRVLKPKTVIIPDNTVVTGFDVPFTDEVVTKSIWSNRTASVGISTTKRSVKTKSVVKELIDLGFNEDLTWNCKTYAGEVTAVCGRVFWGVSKDVEDQLWDKNDTLKTNGQNIRTAGLKFSPIEFRALETIFGKDNAISREVLSYTQGIENVNEKLKMLKCKTGEFPSNIPVKSIFEMKEIDQSQGTMFNYVDLVGSIADENLYPDGLLLELPVKYQTAIGVKKEDNHEGGVVLFTGSYNPLKYKAIYVTDKIYVPHGFMRKGWRHPSGLYGMSDTAILINNVISLANRYKEEPENAAKLTLLYNSIGIYFHKVANMLSSKSGDINNYAMSVRYPYSAKAVATLSSKLPQNTIQIHKNMADMIGVKTGDFVLTERFPCLGFMGVRTQKVHVTSDPLCRYTIRVSGNSLVSQNLDFDGDVLFCAAFHSEASKEMLRKEWNSPNQDCWKYTNWLNNRKGAPSVKCFGVKDYKISPFPELSKSSQASVVKKLTGVKAQTGPVIAMAYNIMRMVENADVEITKEMGVEIEMFVEKAGQSVFEQKHGGQSLHDIVIDAICTGDVNTLIAEGFNPEVSHLICNIIRSKAARLGINDLGDFHINRIGSNIVSRIIRAENKIYFVSRSVVDGCTLLKYLEEPAVDLPSRIFKLTTSIKNEDRRVTFADNNSFNDFNAIKTIRGDANYGETYTDLFDIIGKSAPLSVGVSLT